MGHVLDMESATTVLTAPVCAPAIQTGPQQIVPSACLVCLDRIVMASARIVGLGVSVVKGLEETVSAFVKQTGRAQRAKNVLFTRMVVPVAQHVSQLEVPLSVQGMGVALPA